MSVRRAGSGDFEAVAALWKEFAAEVPGPTWDTDTEEKELAEIADILSGHVAFVAENGPGEVVGIALARLRSEQFATLTDLYVAPVARRTGLARRLMAAVVEELRGQGVGHLDLEVMADNAVARAVYARWGLREEVVAMGAPLPTLGDALREEERTSFGSVHIQSDDVSAVERALRQFVPRITGSSRGAIISGPTSGWIAVYEDVADRDPDVLHSLGREISDRTGAVAIVLGVEQEQVVRMVALEAGRVVDEYLSVPEFYGPLPPGDVVGLAANPRVLARLTGGEPEAIRAVARTALSPADLTSPRELLASLADALGIAGAEHGWADAPQLDAAVTIEPA